MPAKAGEKTQPLHGHALRNHNLRKRSLARSSTAPPLARKAVEIRVVALNMTRIELARRSGISRGALRDLELGVHTPTRDTLERFIRFCQKKSVPEPMLSELKDLYAGPCDSLSRFIARLELKATSSPKLARMVGISAATLWEYRRGNFPVPHALLQKMCAAVGEDFELGERLWYEAERERFINRGFPVSLAEFSVLRLRAGHVESRLLDLGMANAELRRLCHLELLPWPRIAPIAKELCRNEAELKHLRDLWQEDLRRQKEEGLLEFGLRLKKIREKRKLARRELADLLLVGGKKPARVIKHIEEDGHYSGQAFPAGLVALLTDWDRPAEPLPVSDLAALEKPSPMAGANGSLTVKNLAESNGYLETDEAQELRKLWEQRRIRFHLRHRPEMLLDLRLQREYYGFDVAEAARLLGYTSLEYQKIERGIEEISESARKRILEGIEHAGHLRVRDVFRRRTERDVRREAWRAPSSVTEFLSLLARREGGIVPFSRMLKEAGLYGISPPRLRSFIIQEETPTWYLLQQIADLCGVKKLQGVHLDWIQRYRAQLQKRHPSLLSVEVRLLIAEVCPTLRDFNKRLPFNYSVLLRDLYRVERHDPVKWPHIERILNAAGLPDASERWRVIHRLWLNSQ